MSELGGSILLELPLRSPSAELGQLIPEKDHEILILSVEKRTVQARCKREDFGRSAIKVSQNFSLITPVLYWRQA